MSKVECGSWSEGHSFWNGSHHILSDETQRLKRGTYYSKELVLHCGVPQGSALSPWLFNVYIRPFNNIIARHRPNFHNYADDTRIYFPVDLGRSQGENNIAPCMSELKKWLQNNILQLNESKTEIMFLFQQAVPFHN